MQTFLSNVHFQLILLDIIYWTIKERRQLLPHAEKRHNKWMELTLK